LVALAGEIKAPNAGCAGGLSANGVGDRQEIGKRVVFRRDVVLNKLDFLLVCEAVYSSGLEVVEGIVGWGKEAHALSGAVELAHDLVAYLGLIEEANEGGVLPVFIEDSGDVDRAGGRRRWG